MMNEVEKLLQAQLLKEEPDKAFVKWPKYKRKRLKVKRKTVITNKRTHPGTREARRILRLHGRDLTICEMCGRTGKMQIHHKDGNPFNNNLENLVILCKECHKKVHGLPVEEVYDEELEYDFDEEKEIPEAKPIEPTDIIIEAREEQIEQKRDVAKIQPQRKPEALNREDSLILFSQIRLSKSEGYQCRHCDYFRAFKRRCDFTGETRDEHDPICPFFKLR